MYLPHMVGKNSSHMFGNITMDNGVKVNLILSWEFCGTLVGFYRVWFARITLQVYWSSYGRSSIERDAI